MRISDWSSDVCSSDLLGGLDIQLVYFRGLGECRASSWVSDGRTLQKLMRQVDCVGGHTQIERVLNHTLAETRDCRVNALVYVGEIGRASCRERGCQSV